MTPLPLADRQTAVYRLFDADDVLLYVGISANLNRRMVDHRRSSSWWPNVRRGAVTWYRNRTIARRKEAEAINTEDPRYNIRHHNPNTIREPSTTPKIFQKPRMSFEHAAGVLHVPADKLETWVQAGIAPHTCRGSRVWFTPTDLCHFRALYAQANPYIWLPWSDKARSAKRRLMLQRCSHSTAT